MGFILDGLDAEVYDRSYSDQQLLTRILHYFRPILSHMLIVVAMIVGNAFLEALLPLLLARSIDALTMTRETVMFLGGGILIAAVLSWGCNYLRQALTARSVGDIVLRLRQDAFAAVLARDLSFFDAHPSGAIISRVSSDTEDFATVVTLSLNLLGQILLVVLMGAVLLAINLRLGLIALAITPAIVLIALVFRRVARPVTRRAQRSQARLNANIREMMSGIAVAKNFHQERGIYDAFRQINTQSYSVHMQQGLIFTAIFPMLLAVAGVGTTGMVFFGGLQVLGRTVSVGDWFLFIQSISLFWLPLTNIVSFWSQFQQGLSASERVFALIDAEPSVVQAARQPVGRLAGRIEFQDVEFRYNDRETVLERFSLTIAPGETVALVGHTGAGKSSLGKLVARFYEFQSGHLLIDGCDIRSLDMQAYRRQLGIVPQMPFLFSGTVADNIRYARPDASDAAVAVAAQMIGGGDWVEALPNGLATQLGELGKGLSMGQRQLVALARVLLQDPSMIILDEATASIDPLTEARIQESLNMILRDRTAIVIAHRLSTVRRADRIIVLHQGQIMEEGNHDKLMRHQGYYAELYNLYFRHQAPEHIPKKYSLSEITEMRG
jgi:ATP-binding cassette, subfamily B, bacterial